MKPNEPPTDERLGQIVAYLDGEADDENAARIEKEMTRDDGIRREIESLQRAWDMLDHLPMPATNADFSRRTAQLATQSLSAMQPSNQQRWLWPLLWLGGVATAFAIGVGGALARSSVDDTLTADPALLANLDLYRAVGDVAFVDQLQSEGLLEQIEEFVETSQARNASNRGEKAISDERPALLVVTLNPSQLRERQTFLDSLSADEQKTLGELHATLSEESAPNQSQLSVLERYRAWLDTLPRSQRTRIEEAKTTEARLETVREIIQSQAKTLAADLAPLERDRRRGPRSFGRRPEEYLAAFRSLSPKLTEFERQRMERGSFRSRFPLMLVLSAKYDVTLPASLQDAQPFIFEMLLPMVKNPTQQYGGESYAELSDESKKRFAAAAADMLLLPDVDRQTRFAFLDSQPERVASAIEQVTRRNPPAEQTLLNILYYKQHPDAAPSELRGSLDVFDPVAMLERGSQRPGSPTNSERSTRGHRPPGRRFPMDAPPPLEIDGPNGPPPPDRRR